LEAAGEWGWPIVIVACAFLAYAFAGPNIPGAFAPGGLLYPVWPDICILLLRGYLGFHWGVSYFIFLFILFGAYLEKTGLGKFFIDLANGLAGWAGRTGQSSCYFQRFDGNHIR
jgi:TRAP-type uncharacterized transport system fused permease subunit